MKSEEGTVQVYTMYDIFDVVLTVYVILDNVMFTYRLML